MTEPNLQHINIKLFARQPELVNLEDFLAVFNRWIQQQVFDELLVDVADYRHVSTGPGVILIGHSANYSIDNTGNRLGLLYNRKSSVDGTFRERIRASVRSALEACRLLEEEPLFQGKLKFSGEQILLLVNDRLLAPNIDATFSRVEPELTIVFKELFDGTAFKLSRNQDPRERFNVLAEADGRIEINELLGRVRKGEGGL